MAEEVTKPEEKEAAVRPKDFLDIINDDELKDRAATKLGSLPDEELKKIARDVVQGAKFFTNKPDVAKSAFMVILAFIEDPPVNVGSLYADMSDAGPTSVNGYPVFFSCGMLNHEDTKKVIEYIDKIQKAMDAV